MKRYRRAAAKALGLAGGALLVSSLLQKLTAQAVPEPERLISSFPEFVADVVVYRDGDYAVAVDRRGNTVARSTDHAKAIQRAIDVVAQQGGGKIALGYGEFELKSKVYLKPGVIIEGMGYGKTRIVNKISGDYALHYVSDNDIHADKQMSIRDLEIVGDGSNHGIRVEDYFGVEIRNVRLYNLAKGITLATVNLWTEGAIIEKVHGTVNEVGIEFVKEGGTGSFMDTTVINVLFNLNADYAKGIVIGTGAQMQGSVFLGCRFVAFKNYNYGMYIDGYMNRTLVNVRFENQGGGNNCYGIVHGDNATPYYLLISVETPVKESDYSEDNRVIRIHESKLIVSRWSDGRAWLTMDSKGGSDAILEIYAYGLPTIRASSENGTAFALAHTEPKVAIMLDSDNDETGEEFVIKKDALVPWEGTELFKVNADSGISALVKIAKWGLPYYSDCANIPSSPDYDGEMLVCYDSGASAYKLKVGIGGAWKDVASFS